MVQRWKILASLVAFLLALPYALLMIAGGLWLYEHGFLLPFIGTTSVAMLLGWFLARFVGHMKRPRLKLTQPPSSKWPPAGEAAWRDVETIAARAEADPPPIDKPECWWELLREVLVAVAKQFHPKSDQPALEVPLPDALQIVELVSHDMRTALRERVPGSHMLTINDFHRIKRWAGWWQHLYMGYRVVSFGLNPLAALVREVRDAASGHMMDQSADEIQRWATRFCVRRAGFYAIQLYSGQLQVDEETFRSYVTHVSQKQTSDAADREEQLAGEPLRVLVVGQTKAGWSDFG